MNRIKEITNQILSRSVQIKMTGIGWLFDVRCYALHFKEKGTAVVASMDISSEALENITPDAIAQSIIESYQGRGVVVEGLSSFPKKEKKGLKIKLRRKIRI